jgi:glutamyl aminopeptidase
MTYLTKKELAWFQTLSEKNAISGQENEVASYLKTYFEQHQLPILTDRLGSIFTVKKSRSPNPLKVMIMGHMDEIGFMVSKIEPNGMVRMLPIGGINPLTLTSQRMRIKTVQKTYVYGAIDATPPHLLGAGAPPIPRVEDVYLDVGLPTKEAVEQAGVRIGSMITFDAPFQVLNGGQRILGKAFDNRYSLVMGLSILDALKNIELPYDLYVGASVQEEIGLRGAQTMTHVIQPDFAIVLDCSPARDSSGNKDELGQLGGGVLLRYMDRSMVARPALLSYQEKMAKKAKVPYQYFDSPGGTDAGAVHKSADGVLTLTHCIVARSIHSPSTILDTHDFLASKKTLLTLLKDFSSKRFHDLQREDR